MKIVIVTRKETENIEKLIKNLRDLGQEVTLHSGNIFTLLTVPFKLRTGDIYFYSHKETPALIMKIVQRLLNKPVVILENMPKEVYSFERKCYREYSRYFNRG